MHVKQKKYNGILLSKVKSKCVCKTRIPQAATKLKYGKFSEALHFDPPDHRGKLCS